MAKVCRKIPAFQLPPNLKKVRENKNEDNIVITELREKMRRLKFRVLDYQNQNSMLRKELKMADKTSLDKLMAGCIGVKAKLDYWTNRNKEVDELVNVLRLELDRLVEKSNEYLEVQREYPVVERELRARQEEKLDMRSKLDTLKSRNEQLEEELTLLKEDANKMASKTDDDKMLLEALTSQQRSFQDLIERQKMLCESDNRHFRQDMREIHSKHTTNLNLISQLQETTCEKDAILRGLQDYMILSAYAQDDKDEAQTFLVTTSSLTSSEKSE
ncbi:uncharacterized protein NPIL_483981 [Nephila pilipes]|uniref:Uncharacterized protein n=1 Tax=Nephila pilipes TaxID=299642 RepID=A0A8X6U7F1_NEPPI|nr:uncharacterized protein NPIL_483981 [Nephila pilipes]